jgi:PAS domain-containing protein
MEPSENPVEENRRLRQTMRDLVALSTLPAIWIGLGPEGIARSLADVLLNTLSLDVIYVRLKGQAGEGVVEVARSRHGPLAADVEAVRNSLAPLLESESSDSPATIADPSGAGTLHVAITRFGVSDEDDVLVTASRHSEFPTEQDRVLLSVGASQTAIVLQRLQAEKRQHEQREWLRVTVASIGDAVIATNTEGRITFLNSVAEQTKAEQHRNARLAVTQALAQAASIDEAAGGVLQAVCENLGWDVGFFWTVNDQQDALVCRKSWHGPDVPGTQFEAMSCKRTFAKGEGLPGHVWSTGESTWSLDVTRAPNFPRAATAADEGLHSAFACPVAVGEKRLGVIEFFTQRIREPDEDLLEMMGTMAGTLGQFIKRKTAEDELRQLDSALEAGEIVTWTWDIPNNRLFTDENLARLFNLASSDAGDGSLDKYIQSIHPDDWPKVSMALNRSVESGDDYEADYRIVQPDGSVRWVIARGRVEQDESGRAVRMPGVAEMPGRIG